LSASGDPAAACCSLISELQNPLINTEAFEGSRVRVWEAASAEPLTVFRDSTAVSSAEKNSISASPRNEKRSVSEAAKDDTATEAAIKSEVYESNLKTTAVSVPTEPKEKEGGIDSPTANSEETEAGLLCCFK
jgi:hypothetical protein